MPSSVQASAPRRALGGLDGAIERGRAAQQAWIQDGTLVCAHDYAARRGLTLDALPLLEASGELFSIDIDTARWYPAELLRLGQEDAAALCRALSGDDAMRQLVFLMRRHGALGGNTVTAAIAQGRLAQVLELASSWRYDR